MISTGKQDLLTTLNSSGYWYGFLRTGSSGNMPKTFEQLCRTSVGVARFDRSVTINADKTQAMSIHHYDTQVKTGGYGEAMRVGTFDTYYVVPEYAYMYPGSVNTRDTSFIVSGMSMASNTTNIYFVLSGGGYIEYDFGRPLHMRQIGWTSPSYASIGTPPVVQYWDGTSWVTAPISLTLPVNSTQFPVDITAQKWRLYLASGTFNCYHTLQFWADRGTEFAKTPITHIALVPRYYALATGQSDDTYIDYSVADYFSIIAEQGTDYWTDVIKTGSISAPNFSEMLVPIASIMTEVV